MSDRIQNIQKATEAGLASVNTRRGLFRLGAVAAALAVANSSKTQRVANALVAGCEPLATDGKAPLCTTTDNDVFGQSQFGAFYFEDRNNDGEFTKSVDEAVQGVKDRKILVEEIRFAGHGDYVQLNPESRKVSGNEVSYEDVKAGKNSGTRFVDRWTVFQLPADGGDGLGIDLRTNSNRLLIAVGGGSTIDKVWAPVDDGKRAERHDCSGNCQWNCVRFIQFSRLKANTNVDLNWVVPNEAIHRDAKKNNLLSSFTDYVWLWDTMAQSDAHVDYSAINTPLTEALRASEKVVKSYVSVPRNLVPYTNFTR